MVPIELGNTSKHEALKSRTRKYLNTERQASIKDSEVSPTPSIGEKMIRKLFDFCKHLKYFHPAKCCHKRTNAKPF